MFLIHQHTEQKDLHPSFRYGLVHAQLTWGSNCMSGIYFKKKLNRQSNTPNQINMLARDYAKLVLLQNSSSALTCPR